MTFHDVDPIILQDSSMQLFTILPLFMQHTLIVLDILFHLLPVYLLLYTQSMLIGLDLVKYVIILKFLLRTFSLQVLLLL